MTLHLYIARKYLWTFTGALLIFSAIVILVEIVEMIRRFAAAQVGFAEIMRLTLLFAPGVIYHILPLIVIIATIALFISLARSSELVVTRAAGRSALRSVIAPVAVTIVIGGIVVAVVNPMVSATQRQYEVTSNRHLKGTESTLSISPEGLWLRQGSARGQTVIRAMRANLDGTRLWNVSFFGLDPEGRPTYRIEAAEAGLIPGAWKLSDAKQWRLGSDVNPEQTARHHPTIMLQSELTRDQIRDSFGKATAIAFWDLPDFIARLERAGFSAHAHRVWFQSQLALPLTFAAMVMIGAGFTMRHTRIGQTRLMVLLAILMGFAFFFVGSFARILAENGQISIYLATWGPPIAAICLSLGLLLHLEDG